MKDPKNRSGAELLREAAAKMCERIEAVPHAKPWTHYHRTVGYGLTDLLQAKQRDNATAMPMAEYAASWHPGVTLVIAQWLEDCAAVLDSDAQWGVKAAATHGAEAVARAYLGEA